MLHAPSYACVWTLGERLARAPHAPVVFNLNPVAGKAPVVSFFLRPWPTFCSDHDWTLGCSKWWLKMPRSSGLNLGSGKPSRFRPSSNTIQTNYKTSQIFQKWFSLTQEQKPLIEDLRITLKRKQFEVYFLYFCPNLPCNIPKNSKGLNGNLSWGKKGI